jgi:hypothetical protein
LSFPPGETAVVHRFHSSYDYDDMFYRMTRRLSLRAGQAVHDGPMRRPVAVDEQGMIRGTRSRVEVVRRSSWVFWASCSDATGTTTRRASTLR